MFVIAYRRIGFAFKVETSIHYGMNSDLDNLHSLFKRKKLSAWKLPIILL